MIKELHTCRICGNSQLEKILSLGEMALTGVFPKAPVEAIAKGPLALVKCASGPHSCGLLQLAHSYDLKQLYGLNYGYRSGLNKSMVTHLHNKVKKIMHIARPQKGDLIIDIGSNDGTTLKTYSDAEFILVGVDPTGEKFREFYPETIHLISDFFSGERIKKEFPGKKAKIITSFSMFYDLEAPLQFMQDVFDLLDDEGIWVFEQSYMPMMLQTNSFDTICQEHLEYYGMKQIKWMADRVGFKIIDVEMNEINGGSFSVTVGKKNSLFAESPQLNELLGYEEILDLDHLAPFQDFSKRILALRENVSRFLTEVKKQGKKIFGLGASTKGNVILQYCGISKQELPFIGEVNQEKYGCFTPGSLIPIISEEELMAKKPDYLLVLPWHFRNFFLNNHTFNSTKLVFPLPNLEIVN